MQCQFTFTLALISIPPISHTGPSLLLTPKRHKAPGAKYIAVPHKCGQINIKRTIDLRICQHKPDSLKGLQDSIGRRPSIFQEIEADLTGVEVHIWMADTRYEADRWRFVWIGFWDSDV